MLSKGWVLFWRQERCPQEVFLSPLIQPAEPRVGNTDHRLHVQWASHCLLLTSRLVSPFV